MPDDAEPDAELDGAPDGNTRQTAQTIALLTLAVLAVLYTLSVTADLVIPLVLAIMLKLMLQPVMRLLSNRLKLPEAVGALLVMLALAAAVVAIGLSIAVPASGWVDKAPAGLRTLQEQVSVLRAPLAAAQEMLQGTEHLIVPGAPYGEPAAPAAPAAKQAAAPAPSPFNLGSIGVSILLGTQQFFGRLFVLVISLFFMLAAGDTMLRKLVEVAPRLHEKKHIVFIAGEIEDNISAYLFTITAINLGFGVLVGVAIWLSGIADPLLWGTVAFLLNYIPIIGPVIGIGLMFLVGLLTFEHALPALVPAAIYLGLHLLEGECVTPLLLARRFALSPVLVILSLFFWTWLWGVPGAFLSVPLLAIAKIVCDRIPVLAPLGHMLGPGGRRGAAALD
jgi:predicted PurR-regulated permease PerM